jgi:hypothetical protein
MIILACGTVAVLEDSQHCCEMQTSSTFSHIGYRGQAPPQDGLPHVTHAKGSLRVLSTLGKHRHSRALYCNAQYAADPPGTLHQCLVAWAGAAG